MGFFQTCSLSSFNIQFSTIFFIFFLILVNSHARYMPPGGSNLKLIHKFAQMERRSLLLIGSRPPRCEKNYCRNCGHCEAVQVPIAPKNFIRTTQEALGTTPKSMLYSRGDDLSNYKPMCWKCKCGNFMFNP